MSAFATNYISMNCPRRTRNQTQAVEIQVLQRLNASFKVCQLTWSRCRTAPTAWITAERCGILGSNGSCCYLNIIWKQNSLNYFVFRKQSILRFWIVVKWLVQLWKPRRRRRWRNLKFSGRSTTELHQETIYFIIVECAYWVAKLMIAFWYYRSKVCRFLQPARFSQEDITKWAWSTDILGYDLQTCILIHFDYIDFTFLC